MKVAQVKKYYSGKENTPCPLTDKLIAAGYRQVGGGYIDKARKMGIVNPSQYWHLMSYCDSVDGEKVFGRSIVCGELIFWMAEVSEAVPEGELRGLLERIIASKDDAASGYDRKKWNKEIQKICFDKIVAEVERND